MDGTARTLEEIPAAMRVGVVTDGAVRVGARSVTAQRAASCLVAPREGDRVLLAESAEGAWVLAVLSHEGATRLEVDGDLELATPTGRVTVAARDGVEAVTSGTVRVTAAEVAVHASVATAVVDAAEIVGGAVIPLTNGDNAGVALGVASGMVMGPARHLTAAFTVIVGGMPATRLTSMALQNSTNCPGVRVVPSQVRVLILAP